MPNTYYGTQGETLLLSCLSIVSRFKNTGNNTRVTRKEARGKRTSLHSFLKVFWGDSLWEVVQRWKDSSCREIKSKKSRFECFWVHCVSIWTQIGVFWTIRESQLSLTDSTSLVFTGDKSCQKQYQQRQERSSDQSPRWHILNELQYFSSHSHEIVLGYFKKQKMQQNRRCRLFHCMYEKRFGCYISRAEMSSRLQSSGKLTTF